eukprot:scaffold29230_cov79-Isochrysis_galbana.AAC.1
MQVDVEPDPTSFKSMTYSHYQQPVACRRPWGLARLPSTAPALTRPCRCSRLHPFSAPGPPRLSHRAPPLPQTNRPSLAPPQTLRQ